MTPFSVFRARPAITPTPLIEGNIASLISATSSAFPDAFLFPNWSVMNEQNLLGLPAAWYCVNLISNAIAMMMRHAHVTDNEAAITTPLIVSRPNVGYGSTAFWSELVATVLIHGNYVGLITAIDVDGNPLQVTPVHPSNVAMEWENGFPVYRIGDDKYSWRQVVHVRGFTSPGSFWGVGALQAQMRGLTTAYDQQTYSSTSYKTGGAPSVIVSLDTNVMPSQEELERIQQQFTAKAANGNREVAVMPKSIDVKPVQWTPEEMEFLASRQFSVAEIALMFGLNPTDLSASIGGDSQTYANVEQREISRSINSYGGWLHRIEDAWSDLLPGTQIVTGNPDALLKMDTYTRYQAFAVSLAWKTLNEIRALDGLGPVEGGDVLPNTIAPQNGDTFNNAA